MSIEWLVEFIWEHQYILVFDNLEFILDIGSNLGPYVTMIASTGHR